MELIYLFVFFYAFMMFYNDSIKEKKLCLKKNKEYKDELIVLKLLLKNKNITINELYSNDQSIFLQQI